MQIFAMLLGYLLVIRCAESIKRYTNGMSLCVTMLSKWYDTYVLLCAFLRSSVSRADPTERKRKSDAVEKYIFNLAHYFSMLSGFALASLGVDFGSTMADDRKVKPTELRVRGVVRTPAGSTIVPNASPVTLNSNPGRVVRSSYTPNNNPYEVIGDFSKQETLELTNCDHPIALVALWITEELTLATLNSDITVPAPIVARAYQEISNGLIAYKSAYLYAWIPFPFAYAQLVALFMLLLLCFLPYYITSFSDSSLQSLIVTPLQAGMAVLAYQGIVSTATELEQPFGDDANDLPMRDMQIMYLERLEALTRLPMPSTADINTAAGGGPPKRFDGGMHKRDSKTMYSGWQEITNINFELRSVPGRTVKTEFEGWVQMEEMVEIFDVKALTRKFRDEDLARHVRRRILETARPPVSEAEVDDMVDRNLQLTSQIEELEKERAQLLEAVGPSRWMLQDRQGSPSGARQQQQQQGLRVARLANRREEFEQLRADVLLNEARGGGHAGILDARRKLRSEVSNLESALGQMKGSIDAENEEREARARELQRIRKEIDNIEDAKVQLKERFEAEYAARQKSHEKTLLFLTKEVGGDAGDARASASTGDDASTDDESTASEDAPDGDPEKLRLAIWSELSSKKMEDLVHFFSGNVGKGSRSSKRGSQVGAGRASRANVATPDTGRVSTVRKPSFFGGGDSRRSTVRQPSRTSVRPNEGAVAVGTPPANLPGAVEEDVQVAPGPVGRPKKKKPVGKQKYVVGDFDETVV